MHYGFFLTFHHILPKSLPLRKLNSRLFGAAAKICLDLHKLKTLNLTDNHVAALPDDVFESLSSLQKLYLCKNRLEYLNPTALSKYAEVGYCALETKNLLQNVTYYFSQQVTLICVIAD